MNKILAPTKLYPLAALLFIGLLALPVFMQLNWHCFNGFTTSIYSQAMYAMGPTNLNPELSLAPFRIFNYHFEPIILAFAFLTRMFPPNQVLVIIESAFVILSAIPLVYLYKKNKIGPLVASAGVFYLLFHKGVVNSIAQPVHPSTWAVLPISMLCAFIITKNRAGILISTVLLFAFGEVFLLVPLTLIPWLHNKRESLTHYRKRNKRYANGLALITMAWVVLVLFGGYDTSKWHLDSDYSLEKLRIILEICLPLFPILYVNYIRGIGLNTPIMVCGLGRFFFMLISGQWTESHAAYIPIFFLYTSLPLYSQHTNKYVDLSPTQLLATLLIVFGVSAFNLKSSLDVYAGVGVPGQCSVEKERLTAIEEAVKFLNYNQEGALLAEGHLIPSLVTRPEVYMMFGKKRSLKGYRYLYLEKPPYGVSWPNTADKVLELYEKFKATGSAEVIIDNKFIFLGEGTFLQ